MSIRITTLGALQVVRGDTVLSALPSQRLRCALLVYLAANRRSTRDRLLSLFWPERTEERARHALSQNIYELRRALGDDWIDIRAEQYVVASHVSIDLSAFEESAERGDHTMALGLYRGAFLDGFYLADTQPFEAWVDGVRQRVQRQHRRARREWIGRLVDQARLREALTAARDWTTLDPGDDEGQHRLIELLAESGDRAGAIRQFEIYERVLAADDLRPLDETIALIDRVRDGEVGSLPASAVQPASAPPVRANPAAASAAPAPIPAAGKAMDAVLPPVADPEPERSWIRRLDRRFAIGAAFAFVVVASLLTYAATHRPQPGSAAVVPHRIAVLYFDDRSPPPGARYLADGFTEELIATLSGLEPMLEVRSIESVRLLRERAAPVDSLAALLDVDLVISGQLASADGLVRVSYRLIDGRTGSILANRAVDRPDGRYLELLADLVDAVGLTLRQQLGARFELERTQRQAPTNEAWSVLRLGIETAESARRLVLDNEIDRGRIMFARADSILQSAEQFSTRWIEPIIQRGILSETRAHVELGKQNIPRGRAWLDSAVLHAERALARAPRDAAALEVRGSAFYRAAAFASTDSRQIADYLDHAERDLTEATRRDPSRAHAYALLASIAFTEARFSDARFSARRADSIDAFTARRKDNLYYLAMSEFEIGENDEKALKLCREGWRRFGEIRFAYCVLSVMAWSERLPAFPDSAWAVVRSLSPERVGTPRASNRPMLEMLVAQVLLRAGERDSARAVLDSAANKPSLSRAVGWIEAAVRFRLDDPQRAAELLRGQLGEGTLLGLPVRQSRAIEPLLGNRLILRALERH